MKIILLISVLLLTAGPLTRGDTPAELIIRLGDPQWEMRDNAAREILAGKDPRLILLLEAAQDHEDAEIRFRARELLILKKYHVTAETKPFLLPLLTSLATIEPGNTARPMSVVKTILQQIGSKGLPTVLAILLEGEEKLRKEVTAFLLANAEKWGPDLAEAFKAMNPDEMKRLQSFPGQLLLRQGDFAACELFLLNSLGYLDFADIFVLDDALRQLEFARNFRRAHARKIAAAVFRKYTDYFYTEEYDKATAVAYGKKLDRMLRFTDQDLYLDLQIILAEIGDEESGVKLAARLYRERKFARLQETLTALKAEDEAQKYSLTYIRILAARMPPEREARLIAALQERHPDSEEIHYNTGILLIDHAGKDSYGIQELVKVIAINPMNSNLDENAAYRIAYDHYVRMDYKEAERMYNYAYTVSLRRSRPYERARNFALFSQARQLIAKNREEEALGILLGMEPEQRYDRERHDFDHLEFEIILARAYSAAGKGDLKAERAAKVLEFYEDKQQFMKTPERRAEWLNSTAWYLARIEEKIDLAIQYSEESLKLDPDKAVYLDTLAECYFAAGELEKAVKAIKGAIKHHKTETMLAYYQAQLTRFENCAKDPE
ncbi:hypothetical protein ACFL4W_03680 [Planctomycetota bacterium]